MSDTTGPEEQDTDEDGARAMRRRIAGMHRARAIPVPLALRAGGDEPAAPPAGEPDSSWTGPPLAEALVGLGRGPEASRPAPRAETTGALYFATDTKLLFHQATPESWVEVGYSTEMEAAAPASPLPPSALAVLADNAAISFQEAATHVLGMARAFAGAWTPAPTTPGEIPAGSARWEDVIVWCGSRGLRYRGAWQEAEVYGRNDCASTGRTLWRSLVDENGGHDPRRFPTWDRVRD